MKRVDGCQSSFCLHIFMFYFFFFLFFFSLFPIGILNRTQCHAYWTTDYWTKNAIFFSPIAFYVPDRNMLLLFFSFLLAHSEKVSTPITFNLRVFDVRMIAVTGCKNRLISRWFLIDSIRLFFYFSFYIFICVCIRSVLLCTYQLFSFFVYLLGFFASTSCLLLLPILFILRSPLSLPSVTGIFNMESE